MFKKIILSLFLLIPLTSWALPATQYSAYVTTTQGKETSGGKLYVDGNKVRVEAKIQGHQTYSIVRPDLGKVYSVLPEEKAYTEISVSVDEAKLMIPYNTETKLTPAGIETIGGQACVKYQMEGLGGTVYLFVNNNTQAPVLMTSVESGIKTEWKDVKIGPQEAKLFEPPLDYKKLELPAGLGQATTQPNLQDSPAPPADNSKPKTVVQ
ncbi:MAG: hypothetical protein ACD_73C00766G0003 [uncultured bacterium]|nr:MAG: hypothetical protein ACD_73C00766G0003 [uncultured bacterium]